MSYGAVSASANKEPMSFRRQTVNDPSKWLLYHHVLRSVASLAKVHYYSSFLLKGRAMDCTLSVHVSGTVVRDHNTRTALSDHQRYFSYCSM